GLAVSGGPVPVPELAAGGDPELWARWIALATYSPALLGGEIPVAEDPDALTRWAAASREHLRLLPYRYGLAARAADDGSPMIEPLAFRFDQPWDRADAWMLGDALLVAPVVVPGAE